MHARKFVRHEGTRFSQRGDAIFAFRIVGNHRVFTAISHGTRSHCPLAMGIEAIGRSRNWTNSTKYASTRIELCIHLAQEYRCESHRPNINGLET